MRLYDRIWCGDTKLYTMYPARSRPLHKGEKYAGKSDKTIIASIPASISRDLLGSSVVFEVTSLYKTSGEGLLTEPFLPVVAVKTDEGVRADFRKTMETLAPYLNHLPYDLMWLEFESAMVGAKLDTKIGIHIRSASGGWIWPEGEEYSKYKGDVEPARTVVVSFYLPLQSSHEVYQADSPMMMFELDSDGALLRLVETTGSSLEAIEDGAYTSWDGKFDENMIGHLQTVYISETYKTASFLAYCLHVMTCKNIRYVDNMASPALQKASVRRRGYPLVTYKTVELDTSDEVRTRYIGEHVQHEVGVMPVHSCRGHFSEYGPEFGKGLLFGRYAGRFWVPPHMKGRRGDGSVYKDYKVKKGNKTKGAK